MSGVDITDICCLYPRAEYILLPDQIKAYVQSNGEARKGRNDQPASNRGVGSVVTFSQELVEALTRGVMAASAA